MPEFVPCQAVDKSRVAVSSSRRRPLPPLLLFPLHLPAVVDVELFVDVGEARVDGAGGKAQLLADALGGVAKRGRPGVPRTSLGFFLIRESVRAV